MFRIIVYVERGISKSKQFGGGPSPDGFIIISARKMCAGARTVRRIALPEFIPVSAWFSAKCV